MATTQEEIRQNYTDIADAIRAKGITGTMTPLQMPQKISQIETGITPTGTKTITENGEYDVTQFANASVSVAGGSGVQGFNLDLTGLTWSSNDYYWGEYAKVMIAIIFADGTVSKYRFAKDYYSEWSKVYQNVVEIMIWTLAMDLTTGYAGYGIKFQDGTWLAITNFSTVTNSLNYTLPYQQFGFESSPNGEYCRPYGCARYRLLSNLVAADIYYTSCLSPDTNITLVSGTQAKLRDIKVGDTILCYDKNGNITEDEVVFCDAAQHKTYKRKHIYTFEDDTVIEAIHPHRFYNVERQAMVYLHEWNMGEHAIKADGTEVALISHIKENGNFEHATLFTKNHQNYFANGLCSGNRDTHEMHLGTHSQETANPSPDYRFEGDFFNPRVFSKMKAVEALMDEGVWTRVKGWIEETGLYDLYLAANDFKEDNKYFIQGKSVLQSQLGWDDDKTEQILKKCLKED